MCVCTRQVDATLRAVAPSKGVVTDRAARRALLCDVAGWLTVNAMRRCVRV
jgi:hypothetical protein